MVRPVSSPLLKSVLFAGFAAVMFAAPAKSDFVEVAMPNLAPAGAQVAPRLNLDISATVSAEERWGRRQVEWQDPLSIQDPVARERKIAPLFVIKF